VSWWRNGGGCKALRRRRCRSIVKEEQRRRRRHFAAILRTDGQLRPISALQLVDDAFRIAFLAAP
jgi:hypothetical protein